MVDCNSCSIMVFHGCPWYIMVFVRVLLNDTNILAMVRFRLGQTVEVCPEHIHTAQLLGKIYELLHNWQQPESFCNSSKQCCPESERYKQCRVSEQHDDITEVTLAMSMTSQNRLNWLVSLAASAWVIWPNRVYDWILCTAVRCKHHESDGSWLSYKSVAAWHKT